MIHEIDIPDDLWALLVDKATQEKTTPDAMVRARVLDYLEGIKGEVNASLNARLQVKLGSMTPEDKLALVQMLDATDEAKG